MVTGVWVDGWYEGIYLVEFIVLESLKVPLRCIHSLLNVKRPDRQFTVFSNCSGCHRVSRMCKSIGSAVMLFAAVAHLIIFAINIGRFPWLGSCSWPLSSLLLFLQMLPWALMEGNSYRTESNHGGKKSKRHNRRHSDNCLRDWDGSVTVEELWSCSGEILSAALMEGERK